MPLAVKFAIIAVLALLLVIPSPLPVAGRVPLLAALLVGSVLWLNRNEQAYVDDETTPLPWETEAQARQRIAQQHPPATPDHRTDPQPDDTDHEETQT